MFYLFIFESIGTSELILIVMVALIVFGPRKLPELARTLGKAMNEFRRSTDDFKKTWEKEVEFESGQVSNQSKLISPLESPGIIDNSIQRNLPPVTQEIVAPEIKELNGTEFQENFAEKNTQVQKPIQPELTNKRDWL